MPTAADAFNNQPATVEKDEERQNPALARAERKMVALTKKVPAIRRVVRAAARLADLNADLDGEDLMKAIREAKHATYHVYDKETKQLLEMPDHKTRLSSVALELAYREGLPAKNVRVDAESFLSADEILARMRQSPEALRRFPEIAEPKSIEMGVQETG